MADRTDTPIFTGAELALADTIILILDLLMLQGMADREALDKVLAELQGRYQGQSLSSAAAMTAYFRHHATNPEHEVQISRLRHLFGQTQGSA
jgi:hypothetical protein